ncbi:hypothetical protein GGX14DRAFT_557618 [Mycena pura]|uniref:Uncharacterized protein n=1 Tax=Mycena pura TaxID=153505 RepID=A0AAD6YLI1_9AGAR|nr:hypothetical protein GGX14DRAFT_557618 [Mycena pura]
MSSENFHPSQAVCTGLASPASLVDSVHGPRLPSSGSDTQVIQEHLHAFTDAPASTQSRVDTDVHMRDVNDDNDDDVNDDNDDDVNYDDNAKTVPYTSYPITNFTPTSGPAGSPTHVATDYAALLPDEKTKLMHSLIHSSRLRGSALRHLLKLHDGVSPRGSDGKKPKTAREMVAHFLDHRCTDICLVGMQLAQAGGLKARMKDRGQADVHMRDVNDEADDDVNARTDPHTSYPTTESVSSSDPLASPVYVATEYAALLPDEKTKLMHSLIQSSHLRGTALRDLVRLHDGVSQRGPDGKKPKTAQQMVAHFLEHRCTDICLVGIQLAQANGLNTACISDASLSRSANALKLRMKARAPYKKESVSLVPTIAI